MYRPYLLSLSIAAILTLVACTGGEKRPSTSPSPVISPSSGIATPDRRLTPTTTPQARETPSAAPSGGRFTLSDAQQAWQTKGIEVTVDGPKAGFSGFHVTPVAVRLKRQVDSLEASVLVYRGFDLQEDWRLRQGGPPELSEGRSMPAYVAAWWNENIVVVVHSRTGEMGGDALDAFLSMKP